MKGGLFRFVWRLSGRDQVFLSILTVAVFLLNTVPLELQRRVVNEAIADRHLEQILLLGGLYAGVELLHGGLKFLMNVYRGWVNENVTRQLRRETERAAAGHAGGHPSGAVEGAAAAVVVSEAEAVGGFVGMAFSEPLLQGGLLVSVFGYMAWLQPTIAGVCVLLFLPQIVVVPVFQRAINRRAAERIAVMREVTGDVVEGMDAGGRTLNHFDRLVDRVLDLNMGIYWLKFGLNFGMNTFYHLSVAGILVIGGWMVVNGKTEAGTVVAFLTGLHRTKDPWGDLVNYAREVSVVRVKYRMIADLQQRLAAPRQ
jgi:ABC-type multidrug transport system fused ATPase/permease subunit